MGFWDLKFLIYVALTSSIISTTNHVLAQITPDTTLPNNSSFQEEGNRIIIQGGTQAQSNLFHSFKEFGVPNNTEAFFDNAVDIQNIITRVTGKSISEINGLISTKNTANLFLINPNGIVFGENARLDIGGSFVGSTANSLLFEDGFEFSATNPASAPLLTINVPLGLQFGENPDSIQVKGNGEGRRRTSEIIDTIDALRVDSDKTLALVGGDINLEGATLKTAGGRIELGSVAGGGKVSIVPVNKGFSFGYENAGNLGNIELTQQSAVDASGEGAGNIQVNGRRVSVSGGTSVDSWTLGAKSGGEIVVNTSELLEVIGGSGSGGFDTRMLVFVNEGAIGNGGDLTVKAGELLIKDGSYILTSTSGEGKGGDVNVTANNIQVVGVTADGSFFSNLSASSNSGIGDAGNLNIITSELLILDGGLVDTSTTGKGRGGSLNITADRIQVIGEAAYGLFLSSGLESTTAFGTGDAGTLNIKTSELLVKDGGFVSVTTFSEGKAGNLNIAADKVKVIGTSPFKEVSSLLLGITENKGDAGKVSIKTGELLVEGGGQILANTRGGGKGGILDIEANKIQVIGRSTSSKNSFSLIDVRSATSATGDAGELTIDTNELLIQDGASIITGTFSGGRGGKLTINANNIELFGQSFDGRVSTLSSQASSNATGNADSLTINTNTLLVQDGAQVSTGTFGRGNAGNLVVNADKLQVIGTSADGLTNSGLFSQTISEGNAGNLEINTQKLQLRDRARVSVESLGTGTAGNLTINARSINLDNQGLLTANTRSAAINPDIEQATININSRDLILRRQSRITSNARGENVIGGNININSDIIAAFENSDISANSANFRGGNVIINSIGVFGTQFRNALTPQSDITATGANPDLSGNVEVNAPDNQIEEQPQLPADIRQAQFDQRCQSAGGEIAQNSFTITGRGGLPPSPNQMLNVSTIWEDWGMVENNNSPLKRTSGTNSSIEKTSTLSNKLDKKPKRIIEAQGWIVDKDGTVVFTASPVNIVAGNNSFNSLKCD